MIAMKKILCEVFVLNVIKLCTYLLNYFFVHQNKVFLKKYCQLIFKIPKDLQRISALALLYKIKYSMNISLGCHINYHKLIIKTIIIIHTCINF